MPYAVYKLIHLTGIFLVLSGLAGALIPQVGAALTPGSRRVAAVCHGVGLLLALLGGFGMAARLQIFWPWPLWMTEKVFIWLLLGGMMGIATRRPALARRIWWAPVVLAVLAAFLAINHG